MLKRSLFRKIILQTFIMLIVFSFSVALFQHLKVYVTIQRFKARATFEQTVEIMHPSGYKEVRMYHSIPRIYPYELNDVRSVFESDQSSPMLGQQGDIFVTQESPFPSIFGLHQLMKFYVGGHAAVLDDQNRLFEAVGFPQPGERIIDMIKDPSNGTHEFNVGVRRSQTNYWINPQFRRVNDPDHAYYGNYYRDSFSVLRVKGLNQDIIEAQNDYLNFHLENRSLYNFLFIFDRKNKFYCTDLVSRSYRYAFNRVKGDGYDNILNDNGFVTTVNDLINAKDTYLIIYIENKDQIRHIYHLEDL